MQLGRAQLSQEEPGRQVFLLQHAGPPHRCLSRESYTGGESLHSHHSHPTKLTTIKITHLRKDIELGVFIDSGADESLINWGLVWRLGLQVEPLSKPIKVSALNGGALFDISHISKPADIHIADNWKRIRLYLIDSPLHHLILGFPWLVCHNPHINWRTGDIMGWGEG